MAEENEKHVHWRLNLHESLRPLRFNISYFHLNENSMWKSKSEIYVRECVRKWKRKSHQLKQVGQINNLRYMQFTFCEEEEIATMYLLQINFQWVSGVALCCCMQCSSAFFPHPISLHSCSIYFPVTDGTWFSAGMMLVNLARWQLPYRANFTQFCGNHLSSEIINKLLDIERDALNFFSKLESESLNHRHLIWDNWKICKWETISIS